MVELTHLTCDMSRAAGRDLCGLFDQPLVTVLLYERIFIVLSSMFIIGKEKCTQRTR